MDKDLERRFLETLSRSLVSLPFDVKVLLEAVSDPELEHAVRAADLPDARQLIVEPRAGTVDCDCIYWPTLCRGAPAR